MSEMAPAAPWLRLVEQLPRRGVKKCLSGWQQHLKTAAPRPTTWRKMFGRTAVATRPAHTRWVDTTQGPAHTERAPTRGHEAENLGWRSPSLPRRVRGAAALPTPDDMPSEVLATGRGWRWRWKRSSSPRRRRWKEQEVPTWADRIFLFLALSFCFSLLARRGERNWGAPLGLLDSAVAFFLIVILYFISRYMRPEGPWPWQRLRAKLAVAI